MGDFLQTLIIAITLGSLYALIALGYTMVYGILKLINFAHSDIVVLGAWVSYTLATFLLPRLGFDLRETPWYIGGAVLVAAMVICGAIGFTIERLAYKPIRKAPRLNALITAIGVSLLLQNTGQLQFNIIPSEKTVAKGVMTERGNEPKSVRLSEAITLDANTNYTVKILRTKMDGDKKVVSTVGTRKIAAPPGTYAAGTDIAIESAIGRSDTRDVTYELLRISPYAPLKLPFGAMPAGMPKLLSSEKKTTENAKADSVWEHEFTALMTQSNGQVIEIKQPVRVTRIDVAIVGTALLLMVALELLVFHTKLGAAMRAVSFNFDTAGLMGIPVDRIISVTFVTGAMLAAAAGFLYAMKYEQIQQPANSTWVLLGLKAFVAAVVGGIGNVRGATIGGFLIAFIEQFSGVYFQRIFKWDNAAAFTDVYVFALLIIVLLVKPAGLFGSTVREKV